VTLRGNVTFFGKGFVTIALFCHYMGVIVMSLSENAAPVAHNAAPVSHNVAPVAHNVAPVTHNAAPVAYNAAPVSHNVSPHPALVGSQNVTGNVTGVPKGVWALPLGSQNVTGNVTGVLV
jgi:hypothetical protein